MENTNQKQYKRTERSVPDQVRQKISNSLKQYNEIHPRGKASEGSEWATNISRALRSDTGGYWSKIKPKGGETGSDTTIDDIL